MTRPVQMGFEGLQAPLVFPKDDRRLVPTHHLEDFVRWAIETPELVIDYEATGTKPWKGHRWFSANFYAPDKGAKVVDFRYTPTGEDAVKDVIKARTGLSIFHNAPYEIQMSRAMGVHPKFKVWDNMFAGYALLEERPDIGDFGGMSQKAMVHYELKRPTPYAVAVHDWLKCNQGGDQSLWDFSKLPGELILGYGCEDATDAWDLYKHFLPKVKYEGKLALVETDGALAYPLAEMAEYGLELDMEEAERFSKELIALRAATYKELQALVGYAIDVSGHTALFGLLYGNFKLPMHADLEKEGKLDDVVLGWMLTLPEVRSDKRRTRIISLIRDWREYDKLIDTYLLPWLYEHQHNGILHVNLNPCVARTRRFTSSSPNLQNIPVRSELGARLRKCFKARKGRITYAFDYSQVEYREFTNLSREPSLVRGYLADPDFDIHQQVSEMLGVVRKDGKNLNFGILYGMGKDKLARSLQRSKEAAMLLLEDYYARLPAIKSTKRALEQGVRNKGYVKDVLGGTRHLIADDAYKSLNSYCQMGAADLIRRAMANIYPIVHDAGGKMQIQIHDELKFDLEGDDPREHLPILNEVQRVMEHAPEYSIPIRTDREFYTTNWGEIQSLAAFLKEAA